MNMVIGVTGGIASGKSFAMSQMKTHGAVVFSADEAARSVLSPGSDTIKSIVSAFGQEFLNSDGMLDRVKVSDLIFRNEDSRMRLNEIMHPPILSLLAAQIAAVEYDFPAETIVAVEVPLLFETNLASWFELIIIVSSSESLQIARMMARSGIDAGEALRRISCQWSIEKIKPFADIVIENEGTPAEFLKSVDDVWNTISARNIGYVRNNKPIK